MARPKRGKRRRQSTDWRREYLINGVMPAGVSALDMLRFSEEGTRAAWDALGESIMAAWDKPGCRPWAWWEYEAPRIPAGVFPGCHWDGKLPQPRLYLDGTGKPLHEALAFMPAQTFGIWDWYGDPTDPPAFESQHSYLKRHGLLLDGEDEPIPEPRPYPALIEDAARWRECRQYLRA